MATKITKFFSLLATLASGLSFFTGTVQSMDTEEGIPTRYVGSDDKSTTSRSPYYAAQPGGLVGDLRESISNAVRNSVLGQAMKEAAVRRERQGGFFNPDAPAPTTWEPKDDDLVDMVPIDGNELLLYVEQSTEDPDMLIVVYPNNTVDLVPKADIKLIEKSDKSHGLIVKIADIDKLFKQGAVGINIKATKTLGWFGRPATITPRFQAVVDQSRPVFTMPTRLKTKDAEQEEPVVVPPVAPIIEVIPAPAPVARRSRRGSSRRGGRRQGRRGRVSASRRRSNA